MEENYISLFDFLGKPAGGELGKKVAEEATKQKIKLQTRDISTKTYTGKVMLYPKTFLAEYFKLPF
jgi:hypothetical protein